MRTTKKIYQYRSHKPFLKDFYENKKRSSKGFSYKKFSELAGFSSPNYMKLIVEGRRNLTVTNVHQIAQGLKLTQHETEYFEAMVFCEQAVSSQQKNYYRSRMRRISAEKPQGVKATQQDLLSNSQFTAILAIVSGIKEGRTAKQIASFFPKGQQSQVQPVLKKMVSVGLVQEDRGRYSTESDHYVYFDSKDWKQTQKKFLKNQLQLSRQAFDEKYHTNGKFFSHVMTISRSSYEKYVRSVLDFLDSVTAEANREKAEKLVQLNIQLFPF